MTVRALAATALALALLAAPAAAATLEPLKPCYVSAGKADNRREGIVVRGTGFTPSSTIDIAIDGIVQLSGPADVVGDIIATVKAPHQRRGQRQFTLTVAERGNPANIVTAVSNVTKLTVNLRPRRSRPDRRVRFRGRGFTGAGAVYAHYVFGDRERRSVRLARPQGDCGTFTVRRRQIPIRSPRIGDWTLQVDQQRDYQPEPPGTWVQIVIRVSKVFREV